MFISFQQFRLRMRLFIMVASLLVFAYLMLAVLLYLNQQHRFIKYNEVVMKQHNLDVHLLLDIYITERYKQAESAVQIIKHSIEKKGSITIKDEIIGTQATNEQTKVLTEIQLSTWSLGKTRVQYNETFVDSLSKITKCRVAIFQKIPQGMLCISTSLHATTGNRATNVYLPQDWTMVKTVNENRPYTGRLLLEGVWYLISYLPLEQNGNVIGMVAAILPERDFSYLNGILKKKKYLNSGHIYFFTDAGKVLLHRDSTVQKMNLNKTSPDLLRLARNKKEEGGSFRYYIPFLNDWRWQYFNYYERADFYTAIVVPETDFLSNPLAELRNLLVTSFFMFLVVIIVVVYLFSNTFARPFTVLSSILSQIANGRSIKFTGYQRRDEIGTMSTSIQTLLKNMEAQRAFVQAVGEKNFEQSFEPVDQEDAFGNALLQMRDSLKTAIVDKQTQQWAIAQHAHFAQIIYKNQDNRPRLIQQVLANLMKELAIVQGAFYYVTKEEKENVFVLLSAYVYQHQKKIEKKYAIDEGVLGQAYQSREVIEIKELPKNYLKLLHETDEISPTYLIIVPCQTETEVVGLFELVCLKPLEPYQIAFLKELANTVATTLLNIRANELTLQYLDEAQQANERVSKQEQEIQELYRKEHLRYRQLIHEQEEMVEQKLSEFEMKEYQFKRKITELEQKIKS